MKYFFPSWKTVSRYREVLIFVAGLMKDSRPLVQYLYQILIVDCRNQMKTHGVLSADKDLFKSLFLESRVKLPDDPLHNSYINWYDHMEDDSKNRPRDTTPIYFPSELYVFRDMREGVVLENHLSAAAPQTPNCSMYIRWLIPREAERDVLLVCSAIFEHQPVTALDMWNVTCRDSSLTAPRMINPQALRLWDCDLPSNFVENLIQQLKGSGDSLQELDLSEMDLSPYESLLDELLENLAAHHETHKGQRKLVLRLRGYLSEGFRVKWRKRFEGVESIDYGIYR